MTPSCGCTILYTTNMQRIIQVQMQAKAVGTVGIPGSSIKDWKGQGDATKRTHHFWPHGHLVRIGPSIVFTRNKFSNPKCHNMPNLSLDDYRGKDWKQHLSTFYEDLSTHLQGFNAILPLVALARAFGQQ